jgi:hypothetical protein
VTWCKDTARDAAVRAAEDNRTEPLPTLAEAIAAPFACTSCGGFGMDHRCRESCKECDGSGRAMFPKSGSASSAVDQENKGNGMRTERVTLEVTSAHDERLADCIVESIGDCLLHGESVRVVEEPLSDAWAQRLNRLTAERDAAIRERDEAKARVAELETRTSTPGEGSCAAPAAAVTQPWQKATLNQAVSIIVDGGDWGRGNDMDHGKLGAAVIWADKEIDRLSRELKEYAKQLAAYELEKRSASMRGVNCFATPAASGGGEHKVTEGDCLSTVRDAGGRPMPKGPAPGLVAKQAASCGNRPETPVSSTQAASGGGEGEPVAWARRFHECYERLAPQFGYETRKDTRIFDPESQNGKLMCAVMESIVCGAAPPQPRGWLTEEERDLIAGITDDDEYTEDGQNIAKALLARSSPPEVVLDAFPTDETGEFFSRRDVIKALAAAGVAVKETI